MKLNLLVIDEAAQLVEPAPWVPLSWGCKRITLARSHSTDVPSGQGGR